jgi:hypothetical protein
VDEFELGLLKNQGRDSDGRTKHLERTIYLWPAERPHELEFDAQGTWPVDTWIMPSKGAWDVDLGLPVNHTTGQFVPVMVDGVLRHKKIIRRYAWEANAEVRIPTLYREQIRSTYCHDCLQRGCPDETHNRETIGGAVPRALLKSETRIPTYAPPFRDGMPMPEPLRTATGKVVSGGGSGYVQECLDRQEALANETAPKLTSALNPPPDMSPDAVARRQAQERRARRS